MDRKSQAPRATGTRTSAAGRPLSVVLEGLEPRQLLSVAHAATAVQAPYGGVPATAPGTIQLENYDAGGEGVAYHDLTAANEGKAYRLSEGVDVEAGTVAGQYFVGYAKAGEWIEYSVDVPAAGTYRLDLSLASLRGGGQFHLELDNGAAKTARVTAPNTGDWRKFATVSAGNLTLPAGRHLIKLAFDANDGTGYVANLDWMRTSLQPTPPPRGPYAGAAAAIPGTVQAENFDTGGEGVAYHDLTAANEGKLYRPTEAVDVESTADQGGGYVLGYLKAGEWVEYTVDVAASGTYDLTARIASPVDGGAVHLEVDRQNVTGTLRMPVTNAWQTYTDVVRPGVALTAGRHILRLVADANNRWGYAANVNHLTFRTTPPPLTIPPVAADAPLRVSADGRYLVRTDGTPFPWVADTGWRMFNVLTTADADYYLTDRAAKGFTVIRAVILDTVNPQNAYGQTPLINGDPTQPNEAYFQTIDAMVNRAQALGLFVAIVPAWGSMVAGANPVIKTPQAAQAYGEFLGARYRGKNVAWVVNCDWSPAGFQDTWDALAYGLIDGGGHTQLVTSQPPARAQGSTWFGNDPRFDFNTVESDHTRNSAGAYQLVSADWTLQPTRPTMDGEPNYEDIPNGLQDGAFQLTDYDVRKKLYWAYLAGASGVNYGQMDVYQFWQPGMTADFPTTPNLNWRDALNRPGATQMQYLRKLMELRPLSLRVPDQSVLLSPALTGGDHVQAARASDGSYVIVYTASGQAVTVDLTRISGTSVHASWYDPRTGTFTPAGDFANSGSATFTPPTPGTDWVLVLDDASRGYATS